VLFSSFVFYRQKTTAEVPAAAPTTSAPADPISNLASGSGHSEDHSDLIRSLEMTGMASVAAARAVQAATSGVVSGVSIQQVNLFFLALLYKKPLLKVKAQCS
jgi:hypothetical protein